MNTGEKPERIVQVRKTVTLSPRVFRAVKLAQLANREPSFSRAMNDIVTEAMQAGVNYFRAGKDGVK